MIEQVLHPYNVQCALKQVIANKGSAGVDQGDAYAFSRSRKGGWAIAQSPILGTTITISRLKRRGYISMLELHLSLNPSRYEPPYMQLNKMTECHLCKLGACSRTYGGVRA